MSDLKYKVELFLKKNGNRLSIAETISQNSALALRYAKDILGESDWQEEGEVVITDTFTDKKIYHLLKRSPALDVDWIGNKPFVLDGVIIINVF